MHTNTHTHAHANEQMLTRAGGEEGKEEMGLKRERKARGWGLWRRVG